MTNETAREEYVRGTLQQLPIPKALNYIHQAGKIGILAVTRGPKKVHIHFDKGRIVHVTSTFFPGLSLGEFLVKDGHITRDIAEESFENTRTGKLKQGTYLVDRGHISPHTLFEILNTHVTEKLYRLFEWNEGELFFKQGEIVEKEHRILNISIPNLIFVGVRDYFPMTTLPREFKGRKEMVLHHRQDCPYRMEDMAFGPAGTRVYNIVNGQRTLRQVVAGSKMPKSTAYKTVYAMFLLGFVCFPESLHESKRKAEPKAASRKEGTGSAEAFEINIGEDLIAQALASVDRIREEARRSDADGETAIEFEPASTPSPAVLDIHAPAEPDPLGFMDEEESAGAAGEPDGLNFDEQDDFSWDDAAAGFEGDGAHTMPDDSDNTVYTQTDESLDGYHSAEELVRQAVYFLDEGRFDQAERFLNRAVELEPDYAEAYPYLGWCIYNTSAGTEVTRAETMIKNGMRKKPQMYQSFLYLGKIYRRENQPDFAELHFVKAIELNIDCAEAKEEIKKIRLR